MKKDYSDLPKTITITNNNNYDVVLGLRNTIIALPYELKAKEEISITVETSDALALINQRAKELDLTIKEEESELVEPAEPEENEDLEESEETEQE